MTRHRTQRTRGVDGGHYPPAPPGALNREPKARTREETQFLTIGDGDGAGLWLAERRPPAGRGAKMARTAQLAALHGISAVDRDLLLPS